MTNEEKEILNKLYLQRISYEAFLEEYPVAITYEYILSALKDVSRSQDANALKYLLMLASYYGYTLEMGQILSKLLLTGWHKEHEDIVRVLQFKVKVLESVDDLVQAIESRFDYLFQQDDYGPFVTKCMYAIADLQTEASKIKIQELAESSDPIIREAAQYQLQRLSAEPS